MANSYDNGRTHSPWRKIAIIPIWAIEVPFLAIYVIYLGILIGVTNAPKPTIVKDKHNKPHTLEPGLQAWVVVCLVPASIALLLSCLEISMLIGRHLQPRFYLISSTTKSIMWLPAMGIQFYTFSTTWAIPKLNLVYLLIALGIAIIIYASMIGSLIYSVVVFRRYQKRINAVVKHYITSETALMPSQGHYTHA